MLMAKGIRKEKKAIQQHHMISSKNSHVTPAMHVTLLAEKPDCKILTLHTTITLHTTVSSMH